MFDSKLDDNECPLFVLKTIPRQFGLLEFQENFLCFINSIVFDVRELMCGTWHFFI